MGIFVAAQAAMLLVHVGRGDVIVYDHINRPP